MVNSKSSIEKCSSKSCRRNPSNQYVNVLRCKVETIGNNYKNNLKKTEEFRMKHCKGQCDINRSNHIPNNAEQEKELKIIKKELSDWKSQCEHLLKDKNFSSDKNCELIHQNIEKVIKEHSDKLKMLIAKLADENSSKDKEDSSPYDKKTDIVDKLFHLSEKIDELFAKEDNTFQELQSIKQNLLNIKSSTKNSSGGIKQVCSNVKCNKDYTINKLTELEELAQNSLGVQQQMGEIKENITNNLLKDEFSNDKSKLNCKRKKDFASSSGKNNKLFQCSEMPGPIKPCEGPCTENKVCKKQGKKQLKEVEPQKIVEIISDKPEEIVASISDKPEQTVASVSDKPEETVASVSEVDSNPLPSTSKYKGNVTEKNYNIDRKIHGMSLQKCRNPGRDNRDIAHCLLCNTNNKVITGPSKIKRARREMRRLIRQKLKEKNVHTYVHKKATIKIDRNGDPVYPTYPYPLPKDFDTSNQYYCPDVKTIVPDEIISKFKKNKPLHHVDSDESDDEWKPKPKKKKSQSSCFPKRKSHLKKKNDLPQGYYPKNDDELIMCCSDSFSTDSDESDISYDNVDTKQSEIVDYEVMLASLSSDHYSSSSTENKSNEQPPKGVQQNWNKDEQHKTRQIKFEAPPNSNENYYDDEKEIGATNYVTQPSLTKNDAERKAVLNNCPNTCNLSHHLPKKER